MRKVVVLIVVVVLVSLSSHTRRVLAQSLLEVTGPVAGSVVFTGDLVTVTWTGGDPAWFVDVQLVDVEAFTVVAHVAQNVPNSGTADWIFPGSLEFGGPCGRTYLFYVQEVAQAEWTYGPEFTVECGTTVDVDVHPGSFPNSVNPRSRGVIPVALLTTDAFDALSADVASLRLGPSQAAAVRASQEDVDGDGDLDLVLHFRTADTGIACGDATVELSGVTTAGQPIQGSDVITTVGCK